MLESAVALELNERYRSLVESSPDGMLISQHDEVLFANRAALQLFGANTPEQLVGASIDRIFQGGSRETIRERLGQWAAGAQAPAVEAEVARLDGAAMVVEVSGAAFDDGAGRALLLVVRDITGRKRAESALRESEERLRESEERLRLAFTGAQEGVWDWNLETGAVVYSPRWKQMLGYADEEIEPHVSAWERLLHPDDWTLARELNDRLAHGAQTYEGEFRLRHKDGRYVHVLSRGFPVRREPGGPVVRIVGTHFDLTDRKQAEAARARTELLAHLVFAQEDERRRIAREMHDQFGEQLTTLALRIGALKAASRDNPALADEVDALEAVTQQLDRDVDQLVWQLRPTALDDLGLRAALANYIQDWSKRVGIATELHTSGLLDERLPADVETALYRIAQEALTNVARHARATQVEIILERRGDHVLLAVEDDGIGFEPGKRDAAREGFGLRGMRERAGLVGATLEIESAAGQGTTILVRISPGSGPPATRENHA